MLAYDPNQPWSVNVNDLNTAHEAEVRRLSEQRERVSTGPNAEELRRLDVQAIDRQIYKAAIHAEASNAGLLYHDPGDVDNCDPTRQKWIAEAAKRGRILRHGDVSLHDDPAQPMRVERGR